MKIVIGNDHGGFELKKVICTHLIDNGHDVIDMGTNSVESCDYPIYVNKVTTEILNGNADFGILICGTGVGMSMAANKIKGIRAVVCSEPYTARLSREHNNANILALGGRVVGSELAKMIIDTWLNATFIGGRHKERLEMFED